MATILVVDDQAPIREILATFLRTKGHQTLMAGDGVDALALVRERRPDLIITDILMPSMDGYEFVRQMRADPAVAGTRVIFYSAIYQQREALALAQACGVPHIITKPADLDVIQRTVEAALGGQSGPVPPYAPNEFDRDHLRLLTDTVAQEVTEIKLVNERLTALLDASQQLGQEHEPRRLLQKFCHAARDILGARYAAIGLLDATGSKLDPYFISGIASAIQERLGTPSAREGLPGQILRERRLIRVRDLDRDPRAGNFQDHFPPAHSFLGVPIASSCQLYGVLFLTDKIAANEFTAQDEQIAAALAAQLGVACENARRYDEVQRNLRRLEQEMAERRQVECALRANEERLARIVETIADGILFFDADGRITFANSTAERITGLRRAQLLERDFETWAWRFVDDQAEAVTADKSLFARVCRLQASIFAAQRSIERPDGSRVVVSCNAAPILDAEGRLTGVLGSFTDITDRLHGEEARREYTERLKSLSEQLMKAQEVERQRIARELHDEIGQSLTAVKINLQALQRHPATIALAAPLEDSISIVDRTLSQVRDLSLDLRPSILDDLGLVSALRWYLDRQARRAGFIAEFVAEPLDQEQLAPELATTCFRIVQEAVTNIVRHARAERVAVELRRDGAELRLVVRDDGMGFDKTQVRHSARLGLLGMQERLTLLRGHIEIDSAPGKGTRIDVRLPLAIVPSDSPALEDV